MTYKSIKQYKTVSTINLGSYWDLNEIKSISLSSNPRAIGSAKGVQSNLFTLDDYCLGFSFSDVKLDGTIQITRDGQDLLRIIVHDPDRYRAIECGLGLSIAIVKFNGILFDEKLFSIRGYKNKVENILQRDYVAGGNFVADYYRLKLINELDYINGKLQYPQTISPAIVSFELLEAPSSIVKKLIILVVSSLALIIVLLYLNFYRRK